MDNSEPCNDKKACKDCIYYQNGFPGRCHRHSPTILNHLSSMRGSNELYSSMMTLFPEVGSDEWCGEFEQNVIYFANLKETSK